MKCEQYATTGWCGLCYAGIKGRRYSKGHRGVLRPPPPDHRDSIMKYVTKATGTAVTKPKASNEDESFLVLFPAMVEWLTESKWDDGKKRETGTAMLLAEGGLWKLWMHDRDGKRSCWISAESLTTLIQRADEVAQGGAGEWRLDKR